MNSKFTAAIFLLVLFRVEAARYKLRGGSKSGLRKSIRQRRLLDAKLSLNVGAQSFSDEHVSTAPSNAFSHGHAGSIGNGLAISDAFSTARNGGTALSTSDSIATDFGTSISGAFSETDVSGTASLFSDTDAAVVATTTALAKSSEGTTRVESKGVAKAKASASSSIIVDITKAVGEVLEGQANYVNVAGKASKAIGEAIAGAYAGAEASSVVGGVGFGFGLASAETKAIATASAIAVTRAVSLVSNGRAAAFTASQAEGLSVAVAEAFSRADAEARTTFGSASAKQSQLTEAIAQPVVEVLATALIRLTEDLSEAEAVARVTSFTVGDAHSTSFTSTSASGDTSTAGGGTSGSAVVDKSSNTEAENALNKIASDVSAAAPAGFEMVDQELATNTNVRVQSTEGLAEAEAKSNSEINVEVRNSVARLIAESVSSLVGPTPPDVVSEAEGKAISIADAIVKATTNVEISLNVDGKGIAVARTLAVAQGTVITAAKTIVTAISAAISDKFNVTEIITVKNLSEALLKASATSEASAASTGGSAVAGHQSVAAAMAEVLSATLARVFARITDTFQEVEVEDFSGTFSTGDASVTTDSFASFSPSFDGSQGFATTSGGGFADFMSLSPCIGITRGCCQTEYYNKGFCMCHDDGGFEMCDMQLLSSKESTPTWMSVMTGATCTC